MTTVYGWLGGITRQAGGLMLVLTAMAGFALAGGGGPPLTEAVPEIDPGSLGSALSLLIGATLMLARRSRKS